MFSLCVVSSRSLAKIVEQHAQEVEGTMGPRDTIWDRGTVE